VIKLISDKNEGCVFILWGAYARKKERLINTQKHLVITSSHPSPFSVHKFFGCKCFSKANDYLISLGKEPINWSIKNF
jgi:uracil-DNA glycosylase